jgi:flagellar hook-associated protein 1
VSDFKGLNLALTAMLAHRRAIEITGQNVANANTAGYTRQRADLAAISAPVTPAICSRTTGVGGGVTVEDLARLRDVFLDQRALQENGADASLRRTQSILGQIEQVLGEPGDNGIAAQLSEFWAGWEDVANQPDNQAARTQLIQRADTLASGLRKADADLGRLRQSTVDEIVTIVGQVNSTATQIADLNKAIQVATQNGMSPDDLAEQRDLLIDRLGKLAGVTTKPVKDGVVDVYLGGTAIVHGSDTFKLAQPTTDSTGAAQITWANDNYPAELTGGELLALRQGVNVTLSSTTVGGVEGYRKRLDNVANALLAAVNAQHQAGMDIQTPTAQAGAACFTGTGAGYITINAAIMANPALVAAAKPGAGRLDASNAQAMADLATATNGADDLYHSFVVQLGVETDTANRRASIQASVLTEVEAARQSASGVNIDEEITNLVGSQHAYAAAAHLMTAVDEALATLINRTGMVGRRSAP